MTKAEVNAADIEGTTVAAIESELTTRTVTFIFHVPKIVSTRSNHSRTRR